MTCCISSELSIIGFLESSKVECPATLSRHLILPQSASDECKENHEASSKSPSFCVLLHGALKVNKFKMIIKCIMLFIKYVGRKHDSCVPVKL